MPEYLAPGVFVEEVSFRSKSIEGVPTSTTGFVGLAHYGPVQYTGGPLATEPMLVTSFIEFERIYGKLEPLLIGGEDRLPFLAHAARAFFMNGGRRLYISRIYTPADGSGIASRSISIPTAAPSTATWRARWPGRMGNVAVQVGVVRTGDVAIHTGASPLARLVKDGSVVQIVASADPPLAADSAIAADALRVVRVDANGAQTFHKADGSEAPPAVQDRLHLVEVDVRVIVDAERMDDARRLALDPARNQKRYIGRILGKDDPEDESSVVWLDYDPNAAGANPISLMVGLVGTSSPPGTTVRLDGGTDGNTPGDADYAGNEADPDHVELKAPANEVVFGLTRFEANINRARQEVLNPEGINALRFFPGRGSRVWGARTLTSDPEWKYVNVRRLFIYLEHSIDKATQWAVFEPNNEALWRNVSRMVKDFLEVAWRDGALLGATPDQAYFVRCDRTTMTQNDLDNGRLICLIGVAPTRPAEFVIFRIGQWTADARQ